MDDREWVDAEPAAAEAGLGDSRARVLRVVREAGAAPLGVREIAERAGLHPNTTRFHLDGLAEAGLVRRVAEDRDRPGRPRMVYRAEAADGRHSYRLLAEMLASLVSGMLPDPERVAIEAGRAWGRHLADPPAPFQRLGLAEALERLNRMMAGMGFSPEIEHDAKHPDREEIRVRVHNCPFGTVAEQHADVVCPLHLGLIQGALAGMDVPLAAERLDPLVEPHLCLAHLRRVRDAER
ncbi:helix-turn-helix transcriptional regulator [Actinomadura bangladeshensis]|uniref:ArsR family transcriptional regulator n=1 Tax=Actinomadura bangladeshensis TaxID=453573 RepID=A0A4R4P5I8_9ACTN|nr:helix-turn-helix domain-containing protein [Actinomadura bangladeshensis]TDC15967.1 ArsR family transcriptional regulator [Actinomadura bangladeshensis]